jgi:hypothetical protein
LDDIAQRTVRAPISGRIAGSHDTGKRRRCRRPPLHHRADGDLKIVHGFRRPWPSAGPVVSSRVRLEGFRTQYGAPRRVSRVAGEPRDGTIRVGCRSTAKSPGFPCSTVAR